MHNAAVPMPIVWTPATQRQALHWQSNTHLLSDNLAQQPVSIFIH